MAPPSQLLHVAGAVADEPGLQLRSWGRWCSAFAAATSTSTAACRSCAMCPLRAVAGDRADAAVAAPADPRRSATALRIGTVATAVAAAAAAAAASRAAVVTCWSGGGTIDRHERGEDPSVSRRRHHRGRAGQPSLARQRMWGAAPAGGVADLLAKPAPPRPRWQLACAAGNRRSCWLRRCRYCHCQCCCSSLVYCRLSPLSPPDDRCYGLAAADRGSSRPMMVVRAPPRVRTP